MFDPVSIAIQLALLAGSMAASWLLNKDEDKKSKQQQEVQLTIQPTLNPRVFAVGQVKLGGAVVFADNNLGSIYLAVAHCDGPIDSFQRRWFDDKNSMISTELLSADNGALPWGTNISIESLLGDPDQLANTILLSFPVGWTSAHRLRGIAYTAILYRTIEERHFAKVYPGGSPPTLTTEIKGSPVYDPRTGQDPDDPSTWEYSDNAALVILHFLTHPYGFKWSMDRIDLPSFMAFADVCDEEVERVDEDPEPRYRLWGTWSANEPRRNVLQRMLDACDGELYETREGKNAIYGGVWENPLVTLTDDDIIEAQYTGGVSDIVAFNVLKAKYISYVHQYAEVEADPWEDLDSQAIYGEISREIALPMVHTHTQARRIMKIAMAKGNPRHRLSLTTKMSGLLARRQRFIRIKLDDFDGLDITVRVTRFNLDLVSARCMLEVESIDSSAYDWDPETEEGEAPVIPEDLLLPEIPDPTGVTVEVLPIQVDETTFTQSILATCAAIPSNFEGARLIGQYRMQGDTNWLVMDPYQDSVTAVITPVLDTGHTYEVQVALGAGVKQSDWSSTFTVTVNPYTIRTLEGGDLRVTEDGADRTLEAV